MSRFADPRSRCQGEGEERKFCSRHVSSRICSGAPSRERQRVWLLPFAISLRV